MLPVSNGTMGAGVKVIVGVWGVLAVAATLEVSVAVGEARVAVGVRKRTPQYTDTLL